MSSIFFHGNDPGFGTPSAASRPDSIQHCLERKMADYEDLLETKSLTPRMRQDLRHRWRRTYGDTTWTAQICERMDVMATFVWMQLYDDWIPQGSKDNPMNTRNGLAHMQQWMSIGKGLSHRYAPENPPAAFVKFWETVMGTAQELLLDHNTLAEEFRDFYIREGVALNRDQTACKIIKDREDARKVLLYKEEKDDGDDSDIKPSKWRWRYAEVTEAIYKCEKMYFTALTSGQEYELSDLARALSDSKLYRCPAIVMR
ncbi:MAG: hypothetical protein M1812_000813 [Candelaria pacifica]|nr:MAG: hypothetical protein M1812_000813 [Candelaria pacifica]